MARKKLQWLQWLNLIHAGYHNQIVKHQIYHCLAIKLNYRKLFYLKAINEIIIFIEKLSNFTSISKLFDIDVYKEKLQLFEKLLAENINRILFVPKAAKQI